MIFKQLNNILKEYALECYPEEMCGIIVDLQFIPCKNIAKDPKKDFEISNREISDHMASGKLQAIVHSHPSVNLQGIGCPSKQDMIGQISSAVTWGIVDTDGINVKDPFWWGDHQFDEALIGKQFRPGVDDCYSLIRKYYKQRRGVLLPEFPRDDAWWTFDENLYVEGFKKASFYRVSKEELKDGDVILGKVQSSVINHGGVIMNNEEDGYGLVIHHLPKRLSRRESANAWINRADLFLRYKDVT